MSIEREETIKIIEVQPNKNSLVFNAFDKIDYRDAFKISFPPNDTYKSIDDFATNYFLSQPTWLRMISMNTVSKQTMLGNLEKSNLKIGTNIGSWKIFDKNEKEIVFGESMGFMDYRFSMRLDKNATDDVEVSTVVKLNGFMGKYYFALVKLMHKKFVKISLENVINN